MINLLSAEQRARLGQTYRQRLLATGGFFLLSLLFVALLLGGLLIKTITDKQSALAGELEREHPAGADGESDARMLAEQTRRELAVIKSLPDRLSISGLWREVLAARSPNIRITSWRWRTGLPDRQAGGKETAAAFDLSGVAASRASLLDFLERLKKSPMFTAVESPIANLIKSRDVNFTLKLTLPQNDQR